MGAFVRAKTKDITVTGPEGAENTVTIKAAPSYGDQSFVSDRSVAIDPTQGEAGVSVRAGESSLAMLLVMIKGWRGPDFEEDGKPVPVSEANVRDLDSAVAKQIQEAVTPLFRGVDEAEGKS